jgi:hypothetical protein
LKECIMKTVTSITAAALAAALASVLIAGTAHAHPPTDWSASKINRQATKTVKEGAARDEAAKDQRRSQREGKVAKPRKPVDVVVRFGTPNRY